MAFRRKSPQRDFFNELVANHSSNDTLAMIDKIIDWNVIRRILSHGYDKSGVGYPGFDPVILAKMLLLEALYNLSDVKVVEESQDRLSFRRFLGLELSDKVPDDTTLVRFRKRMNKHGLLEVMEETINEMIAKRGLAIQPGAIKIIDASLIEAATRPPRKKEEDADHEVIEESEAAEHTEESEPEEQQTCSRLDTEADFTVKNKKPHYGYKLHLARDRVTGLITAHELTKASVHDSNVFEELLTGDEGAVLADKGYHSHKRSRELREKGTEPLIMARVYKERPWLLEFNKRVAALRAPVENTFANLKRWRRCGRAVYLGLQKVKAQMTWGIIAHNLLIAKSWMEKCAQ